MSDHRSCPTCKGATEITKGTSSAEGFVRTRRCKSCGAKFKTVETMLRPHSATSGAMDGLDFLEELRAGVAAVENTPVPLPVQPPEHPNEMDDPAGYVPDEDDYCDEYGNPLPK